MGKTHNKKRNVGIIYEQIISFICNKTLEGDISKAKKATSIIKEHFNNNKQLGKEYKLFKALIQTKGISDSLSTSIINEAKKACNNHFNEKNLEFEKSKLIKELNYSFGKGELFKNKVSDYKIYATVQTLLNEWRKGNNIDISITSEYEKKLHEWMTSSEENKNEILNESKYSDINQFTLNIMNNKFNKKYDEKLNEDQKKIISMFILNESGLSSELSIIKENSLKELNNYRHVCDSDIILESYNQVINKVKSLDCENTSDDNLKKFLSLSNLIKELKGDE